MKDQHLELASIAIESVTGIPVGSQFHANGWRWFDVPFRCAGCSHCAVARIWGWGSGDQTSPFGLRDAAAYEAARNAAWHAARWDAQKCFSLAACPACGARSSQAVAILDQARRRTIRYILLLALLAMLPFALLAWTMPWFIVAPTLVIAFGCYFLIDRANRVRRDALAHGLARVTFASVWAPERAPQGSGRLPHGEP
jgi:hypothetical protein